MLTANENSHDNLPANQMQALRNENQRPTTAFPENVQTSSSLNENPAFENPYENFSAGRKPLFKLKNHLYSPLGVSSPSYSSMEMTSPESVGRLKEDVVEEGFGTEGMRLTETEMNEKHIHKAILSNFETKQSNSETCTSTEQINAVRLLAESSKKIPIEKKFCNGRENETNNDKQHWADVETSSDKVLKNEILQEHVNRHATFESKSNRTTSTEYPMMDESKTDVYSFDDSTDDVDTLFSKNLDRTAFSKRKARVKSTLSEPFCKKFKNNDVYQEVNLCDSNRNAGSVSEDGLSLKQSHRSPSSPDVDVRMFNVHQQYSDGSGICLGGKVAIDTTNSGTTVDQIERRNKSEDLKLFEGHKINTVVENSANLLLLKPESGIELKIWNNENISDTHLSFRNRIDTDLSRRIGVPHLPLYKSVTTSANERYLERLDEDSEDQKVGNLHSVSSLKREDSARKYLDCTVPSDSKTENITTGYCMPFIVPLFTQPSPGGSKTSDKVKHPGRIEGLCHTSWFRPRQSVTDKRLEAIRKVSLWIGDCLGQEGEKTKGFQSCQKKNGRKPSSGIIGIAEGGKLDKSVTKGSDTTSVVSKNNKCAVVNNNLKCAVTDKQKCASFTFCKYSNTGNVKYAINTLLKNPFSSKTPEVLCQSVNNSAVSRTKQLRLLKNEIDSQINDTCIENQTDMNNSVQMGNLLDGFDSLSSNKLDSQMESKELCSEVVKNQQSKSLELLEDRHSPVLEGNCEPVKGSYHVLFERSASCVLETGEIDNTGNKTSPDSQIYSVPNSDMKRHRKVLSFEQIGMGKEDDLDRSVKGSFEQKELTFSDTLLLDRANQCTYFGADKGDIGNCVNTGKTVNRFHVVSDVIHSNSGLVKDSLVNGIDKQGTGKCVNSRKKNFKKSNKNSTSGNKFVSDNAANFVFTTPYLQSNNTVQSPVVDDDFDETNSLTLNLEDFTQAYNQSLERIHALRDIDHFPENGKECTNEKKFVEKNQQAKKVTSENLEGTNNVKIEDKQLTVLKRNDGTVPVNKTTPDVPACDIKSVKVEIEMDMIDDHKENLNKSIQTAEKYWKGSTESRKDYLTTSVDKEDKELKLLMNSDHLATVDEVETDFKPAHYSDMTFIDDAVVSGQNLQEIYADGERYLEMAAGSTKSQKLEHHLLLRESSETLPGSNAGEVEGFNNLNSMLVIFRSNSNEGRSKQNGYIVSKGGNSVSLSNPNSVSDDLYSMGSNSEANSFTIDEALVGETEEDHQWNETLKSFILQNLENEPNAVQSNGQETREKTSVDVELLLEQKLAEQYLNRNIESLRRKHSMDQ